MRNLEYLAGNRFASNVGSKLLSVDELADPQTFGVEKVPVSGSGELIEEEYYSEQYDYTANVVLQSMASRVEIQSIKLVAKNAETEIKSYELEAILINNFYAEANLDGAYTTELTNYGTNMHAYEEHHAQFNYKATHKSKYLFASGGLNGSNQPQPLGGDGTAFIKYPDPSEGLNPEDHTKVWGYNIFPNDLPGINTREYLPHIVIHLLNVTYDFDGSGTEYADETVNAQTDGAELWLTVRGYQDNAGKVQTFDRGIAYLIGGADGFEVNLEDFGLFPETPSNEDITVKVTATAIPWTTTVVEPSF
ncbi:MAG: hypothetical protein LBQ65_00595 [Tannerellaceae bacterium]|nr:hypothetical protein [Tannerellaceae bacterium]